MMPRKRKRPHELFMRGLFLDTYYDFGFSDIRGGVKSDLHLFSGYSWFRWLLSHVINLRLAQKLKYRIRISSGTVSQQKSGNSLTLGI
jgi:hypothetical protein